MPTSHLVDSKNLVDGEPVETFPFAYQEENVTSEYASDRELGNNGFVWNENKSRFDPVECRGRNVWVRKL